MPKFLPYTAQTLNSQLQLREGEVKFGQSMLLLDPQLPLTDGLAQLAAQGAKFAIIGIAEDVGPLANLGRAGSIHAFATSVEYLINLQSNRYFKGEHCALLGVISAPSSDKETDLKALREQVDTLDTFVIEVMKQIMAAGLEPIVIGGGHNNAFGLISATKEYTGRPVAAVNLDPHCDFRPREGRHSGNGFSYAAATGALSHYHVLGLHEQKNSETSLAQLQAFGGTWHTLQQIWIRQEIPLPQALQDISDKLLSSGLPVGLELDVDAISKMPSSASTFAGVPLLDACKYIHHIASNTSCHYLHLAEAAPSCHDAGLAAGNRDVGQAISELILVYLQARTS
ncbi:formimidoylglutamase [Shewanella gelidii]|uniref:Formimidoylglutamase HutG n=1 Tax=Shewanella gelidii TaxID=1642821 RepID=A0A917NCW9_9GAMM|nr:formimidoylglutamase [Shewanella gelidii]MCL1098737.1 formimidoylglutamase [Shewanella gelidii]GGI88009.1 formimidoylglutamase HutG [Shewanella gelidii]